MTLADAHRLDELLKVVQEKGPEIGNGFVLENLKGYKILLSQELLSAKLTSDPISPLLIYGLTNKGVRHLMDSGYVKKILAEIKTEDDRKLDRRSKQFGIWGFYLSIIAIIISIIALFIKS